MSKGNGNHRLRTLPFHEHVLWLLGRYLISEKLPGKRTPVEIDNFEHWRKRYQFFIIEHGGAQGMLGEVGRWIAAVRIPPKHRKEVIAVLKEVYKILPEHPGALDGISRALHSLGVKRMPSRASKE